MVKIAFIVLVVGLLMVSSVSAYICINTDVDNEEVIDFKNKINMLALQEDRITNNLTDEAIIIKLKYFLPCK